MRYEQYDVVSRPDYEWVGGSPDDTPVIRLRRAAAAMRNLTRAMVFVGDAARSAQ